MTNNQTSASEQKKSTKKFLVIYSIAIFIFAVSLILIVSFSQQRIEHDAALLVSKAENAEEIAADKDVLLDGAMTENTRLQEENESLRTTNNSLTTQIAGLEQKAKASSALIKIMHLAMINDDIGKQTAITAFEENKYPAILTPEETAIYNSLK